jgi:hypothetical protein
MGDPQNETGGDDQVVVSTGHDCRLRGSLHLIIYRRPLMM